MKFLKPDIEITSKILYRDNILLKILCVSIIIFTIYAYINNFSHFGIYLVMAIVAFLFLGDTPEIPNELWTSSQKAQWTKKFTTLKIKNNELVYIFGTKPSDKEVFLLNDIISISYKKNKIIIQLNNETTKVFNSKYWNPSDIKQFIKTIHHLKTT